ncbi:hypothetical protein SRIMM317S_02201 [Streptomyces rimosus subsp. rimosus]
MLTLGAAALAGEVAGADDGDRSAESGEPEPEQPAISAVAHRAAAAATAAL